MTRLDRNLSDHTFPIPKCYKSTQLFKPYPNQAKAVTQHARPSQTISPTPMHCQGHARSVLPSHHQLLTTSLGVPRTCKDVQKTWQCHHPMAPIRIHWGRPRVRSYLCRIMLKQQRQHEISNGLSCKLPHPVCF